MKKNDLDKQELEEIEKFGANTWFVEYLYKQYNDNPDNVPEQWKSVFKGFKINKDGNKENVIVEKDKPERINYPVEQEDGVEYQVLVGSAARIIENMSSSLSVPVATSQRTIPVKLLEENRKIINDQLRSKREGKLSFTHLVAWAIVIAAQKVKAMNNGFQIINGKPTLLKREHVNLGLAIDIEKKDGSRSLIVPNIKATDEMNFRKFYETYEDLVKRSRKGQIDPSEFFGTTISLTNPGTLGTISSIPRLMVGQGAIIATGSIQYPSEYQAVSQETISTLGISKIMNITSTYDHRIIQGAESGLFLNEVQRLLLGEDNFYKNIFNDLKIIMQPLEWRNDYQPGIFNNNINTQEVEKQARVLQLINLYRVRGHLIANLNPLGAPSPYHEELDPSTYTLSMWDFDREFITGGFSGLQTATLRKILEIVQQTYCDKIGVEYMHIQNPEEKLWLQNKMEPIRNKPELSKKDKKEILEKLILAENFEHYMHTKFVGHKRFSIEGSETVIPVLDVILNEASKADIVEVVFGMAHRGRLNVLANIIGKSYEEIFNEFEDIVDKNSFQGSGDVKYHLGAAGKYKTRNNKFIDVSVASNPSHLEWVDPVVEGIVRAKQQLINDSKMHRKVMPILLHGDAAFAGQGVVAETLNLSQLSGYRTGGTIHIIINNQIGFTTLPEDARSSTYATDVAKMIQAPIFHVNGDDPEASIWIAKLAFEYRRTFKKDVVIDLFGYRRHGHNEGDEPGFTQPLLYAKIKNHPSVRTIYSDYLLKEKVLTEDEINELNEKNKNNLDIAFNKIKSQNSSLPDDSSTTKNSENVLEKFETKINESTLKEVVKGISNVPEDFNVHPKLKKFLEKRLNLINEDEPIDWAFAESLAFGSLLTENIYVRLSGQDSVRGTFSQRHLALTDVNSGEEFVPLNHINDTQSKIEALDSFLSEAAVLGFEYGYSIADPKALVLWEAQFGDFANGAQIIIDNFIVASYEKWKTPNKVGLLLPHAYEGQGPEHSSARLERFLTLCAQNNMYICNLTTPAQYFHLLRRQAKYSQIPFVLMTPKSLLRLPEARSHKNELLENRFFEIIDDEVSDKNKIKRIILTSGKVYYELLKYRTQNNIEDAAIIRVEQFYPFNKDEIKVIIQQYTSREKIIWVQEEPKNMGGWYFMSQRMFPDFELNEKLYYSGRPVSASPAVGSLKKSIKEQQDLIEKAFK